MALSSYDQCGSLCVVLNQELRFFLLFGSGSSLLGFPSFSGGYYMDFWLLMIPYARGVFIWFLDAFMVRLLRLLVTYFLLARELG